MRISTWVITLLVLGVGCSIAPNEERSPEPTVGGSAPLDPRSVQFVGRPKVSAGMVGSDRYPAPLPSFQHLFQLPCHLTCIQRLRLHSPNSVTPDRVR